MTGPSWSVFGAIALVLGLLATAEYATELTRQQVLRSATPASGELPAAACPADELEEENLSAAECRHLVERVEAHLAASPPGFTAWITAFTAAGTAAGLWSVLAGIGLLQGHRRAATSALAAFLALAVVDGGTFTVALTAGPLLRAEYLWDALTWLVLHLMLAVAALSAAGAAPTGAAAAGGEPRAGDHRPFPRVAAWCHLLIALSVLFLFVSSWWMLALPLPSAEFTYRAFPFQLHKNLGLTVVLLLAAMAAVRLRRPPSPPAHHWLPPRIHRAAVLDHALLYVLLLVVAVSGYMSSSYSGWSTTFWWLVELPHWGYENEARNIFWSDVHLWSCWALLAVMAVHVCGALYHAFQEDGFVRRMLRR